MVIFETTWLGPEISGASSFSFVIYGYPHNGRPAPGGIWRFYKVNFSMFNRLFLVLLPFAYLERAGEAG